MPKPVPWDWAQPRLMPLLAGPYFDSPGEELIRSVLDPGIAVAFGMDLGHGVLPFVDVTVARRWECSAEQIRDTAMTNLVERAAKIEPSMVTSGTLSGHLVRLLRRPAGWTSSVLLVPEELKRLFGAQDQVFAAAGHSTLISLPVDIPPKVAAYLTLDFERKELYPLMLDPFALVAGELIWDGATNEFDDD
ncbi:MAG: hypothetical protein ACRDGV_12825 [Candidatus Limnocylindria bacterium]